jgi:hypothetical protein
MDLGAGLDAVKIFEVRVAKREATEFRTRSICRVLSAMETHHFHVLDVFMGILVKGATLTRSGSPLGLCSTQGHLFPSLQPEFGSVYS